jgi:hypothetical protein
MSASAKPAGSAAEADLGMLFEVQVACMLYTERLPTLVVHPIAGLAPRQNSFQYQLTGKASLECGRSARLRETSITFLLLREVYYMRGWVILLRRLFHNVVKRCLDIYQELVLVQVLEQEMLLNIMVDAD